MNNHLNSDTIQEFMKEHERRMDQVENKVDKMAERLEQLEAGQTGANLSRSVLYAVGGLVCLSIIGGVVKVFGPQPQIDSIQDRIALEKAKTPYYSNRGFTMSPDPIGTEQVVAEGPVLVAL